jgi:hypothetical protein
LSGSPVELVIEPNIAVASRCYIEGDGASLGTVGVAATLTLYARDSFGNDITQGGDVFLADITNPSFSRTIVVPLDNQDGSYSLAYGDGTASNEAGPHTLSITLGGRDIFGSPFLVSIRPGPLDLFVSQIIFSDEGIAGKVHEIAVDAKDKYGNTRTDGGSEFVAIMPDRREFKATYIADSSDRALMKYNNKYLHNVIWTQSGHYNIEIQTTFADSFGRTSRVALGGFPIVVGFGAAEIAPAKCTASGPGTTGVYAGGNASILIHPRDAYGNDVKVGGSADSFEIFVIYTNPVRVFNFSVTDLNTGKYSTWFILTSTGSYGVEIKRAGAHISGSPYLIQVVVAPLDPAKTLIKGAGINGGVISRTSIFRAKLFDSYGNPQLESSAKVEVMLSDERLTTIPAVKDLGNGEVEVSYMGVVLGTFDITVIVNNVTVPGSPFTANIVMQAGAPSADTSLIVSSMPITFSAGTSGLAVLELRDRMGLKIDVGDHLSSFSATWIEVPGIDLATPVKEGLPNEDGTYNILLPSSITRSGVYGLQVFVQTKHIQASPFNVTVGASDVYAMSCRPLPMAVGEIYTLATAGVTGQFLVEIRDFYGNAIAHDPRADIGFEATMTGVATSRIDIIKLTQGLI